MAQPAMRLALARCLAWALLFGGWLALGALGRRWLPLAAGGLAPVALWLAMLGAGLALASLQRWSPPALRRGLATAAVVAAAGACALSVGRPVLGLGLLATGWAGVLVAASLVVRLLRRPAAPPAPTPVLPAWAGATLAWAALGDAGWALASPGWLGLVLAATALALVLLLPRRAAPVAACRAGLFDCALALAPLASWRRPAAWPQAAAALAMLPMMATLAAMADWCSGPGRTVAATTASHMAAMLLPALLLRALPVARQAAVAMPLTAALLVLGGGALAWPGLDGLMTAGLLHGIAWGLAWGARWSAPRSSGPAHASASPGPAAALPAALAALVVLALGEAIAQWGPAALAAVHALLALLGGMGALAGLVRGYRARRQPMAAPPRRRPPQLMRLNTASRLPSASTWSPSRFRSRRADGPR